MPSVPIRLRLAAMLAVGAALALASPLAAAQPGEGLVRLRQVFSEGRALEDKGSWAEALDKFKEVAAAKMTPQVRFHMALCEENLGKLLSAIHGFELAAAEGTAAGSSAVEVPPAAKQHAEALRGRVAKLRIEVSGKVTTSRIALDGSNLTDKDLGTELDVDPGPHVIEIRDASGKSTLRKEVTLPEKGSDKVEVTVSDPEDAPPEKPPGPVVTSSSSRVPAYVTGGIGVAALVGSGVFFGLRASNIATVASHCADPVNHTGCTSFPGDQSLLNQGKTYNSAADALLGIGLAGLGAGTILFFVLAPKPQPSGGHPPPSASMRIVPSGTGLKLIGSF